MGLGVRGFFHQMWGTENNRRLSRILFVAGVLQFIVQKMDNRGFTADPEVLPVQIKLGEKQSARTKSAGIVSADFETALSKCRFGKFNVMLLIVAFPAACSTGFVTNSLSYVIPAATEDLQLTPTHKAMLQSSCYLGMIFGGFLWGSLSDKFGRKKLLVAGYFLDFTMNTMVGLFASFPLMVFFKCLAGFVVCGPSSIFTAYVAEVFHIKVRDEAVFSAGIFGSIAVILQAGLALVTIPIAMPDYLPLKSWQLFIILCGVPSLICGVGFLFFVESPKYLMDKGNTEAALQACRTIYIINTGKAAESYPVKELHQKTCDKKAKRSMLSESVDIFKPPYIQRAIFFFIIQIGMASSIYGIWLWLPEMLTVAYSSKLDAGLGLCPLIAGGSSPKNNQSAVATAASDKAVYIEMIKVNAGCLLGHLVFMVLVNYLGKKRMLISSALFTSVCAWSVPQVSADWAFLPASGFLSFQYVIYYCSVGMIVSVFPTKLRATSISLNIVIGRIGVLFSNFLIAKYVYSYCELYFYVLAATSIGIIAVAFFLKDKPIEDGHASN